MKTIIIGAAALLLGTAAIAQTNGSNDMSQPATSSETTTNGTTGTDTTANGGMPNMNNGSMNNGSMNNGSMSGSMNTTSGSGTMSTMQTGNMTPPPESTGPYPPCSRTVTDHCTQMSDSHRAMPHHSRRHR